MVAGLPLFFHNDKQEMKELSEFFYEKPLLNKLLPIVINHYVQSGPVT